MKIAFVKVVDDCDDMCLINVNNIDFHIDGDHKCNIISAVETPDSRYEQIVSVDGSIFDVSSFKAKTIQELFIALDMHNCIHGLKQSMIPADMKEVVAKNAKLEDENARLKEKLKKFRRLLDGE